LFFLSTSRNPSGITSVPRLGYDFGEIIAAKATKGQSQEKEYREQTEREKTRKGRWSMLP